MKKLVPSLRIPLAVLVMVCSITQLWAADYPTTLQALNPVGYWRFNETTAAPPINKVANQGSLGSAADGYIVLDVGKGEPGIVGNAIRLNNPGSVVGNAQSKIDVPFNPGLNRLPPFSVEFWAKPASVSSDSTGVSPLSSMNPNWNGGGNRSGYLFYANNAHWQFRLGTIGGYAGVITSSSGAPVVGVWQHVVATYDGSTANLYVNGTLVGSVPAPLSSWNPNTQMAFRLGGTALTGNQSDAPVISQSGISGNRCFDGWVDEVAYYPSLLSASQVAAHYSAATTNNAGYSAQILADNPSGYWSMNEPAVTAPDPSTFPIVANSGSAGATANGTNMWGAATAQPGAAYGGFGAGNNAIFFNGESGYVGLQDSPALHFSGNITLAAWVKPTTKDFFRDILVHGWNPLYQETFLRITRNGSLDTSDPIDYGDGTNYYEIGATDAGTFYDSAMFPIPDGDIGNWVFLAGTYDGSSWNLYRNGQLVASLPSPNGAMDITNRWTIGSRADDTASDTLFHDEGLFFGGMIDEPAIFNTALSAANIAALYNAAQVPPVITRAVKAPTGTIYSGGSVSLNVWAEGSPVLTYAWTSNGVPLGIGTTNMTVNNLAPGNPTFAVIVTNPYGSTTSSVTLTVVASAPLVLQQPQPATRYTGFPFSFSVVGGGSTPLTYQWNKNGSPISGATGTSYSGTANSGTAGNYSCTLMNSFGSSNTVAVALTVLPIPSGYAGAVVSSTPLAYWRLGEASGAVGYDYAGGHDATYVSAALGQQGYSVIDPDTAVAFSGVNSYAGNISGDPAAGGINFSGHTNFTLEAWVNAQSGLDDESTVIAKGAGSSGTTATEQFSLDVVGGHYRFFTRGGGNSLYDANAVSGPNGTWQHLVGVYDDIAGQLSIYVNGQLEGTHTTRAAGVRASTAVVAIGSKHLGNDPAFDGTFNGTIDEVAVYNYAMSASTVQAHYAAAYGPSLRPQIAKQPSSLTNYVSLPATFSVSAYGTVPLAYQWRHNGSDVAGATSSSFTIPALAFSDAGTYAVNISNANGNTNSTTVNLTVLAAPTTPPAIPGLVLHLPFDGNLTDATGRGNNGTAIHITATSSNVSSPSFASDGVLGQALHYNSDMGSYNTTNVPTTTNNDYVTLGVRPDLQFGSTADFSVAFWIRLPANYTGGDLPFFTDTVGSTFGAGFVFAPSYGSTATSSDTGTTDGGWAYSLFDGNGNGVGIYGDIGSINDGFWHHLVHVFQRGVSGTTYLDGIVIPTPSILYHGQTKQAGTSAGAAGNIDTGNPATIGQDPTGTYAESGSGDIDDLGVWRKALTPLEAASIYMAAVSNHLSYVGAPITLTMQRVGNNLQLSWPAGTLQSSISISGPWADVTPKSPLTVPPTGGQKFYRVRL